MKLQEKHGFLPHKHEKCRICMVDKFGIYHVKDRVKVHQTIERTPKSVPEQGLINGKLSFGIFAKVSKQLVTVKERTNAHF